MDARMLRLGSWTKRRAWKLLWWHEFITLEEGVWFRFSWIKSRLNTFSVAVTPTSMWLWQACSAVSLCFTPAAHELRLSAERRRRMMMVICGLWSIQAQRNQILLHSEHLLVAVQLWVLELWVWRLSFVLHLLPLRWMNWNIFCIELDRAGITLNWKVTRAYVHCLVFQWHSQRIDNSCVYVIIGAHLMSHSEWARSRCTRCLIGIGKGWESICLRTRYPTLPWGCSAVSGVFGCSCPPPWSRFAVLVSSLPHG